jgi:DNA helicase-2/ATP-dependent DNA helicase PcrA
MNPKELLRGLSAEQQLAATAPAPLRIIAPAGSGKTLVLARRLALQLTTGAARAHTTAALTFTRAAAHELRKRLARLVEGPLPLTATVHGAALLWLGELARAEGRRPPRVADTLALLRGLEPGATPALAQALHRALRVGTSDPRLAQLVERYRETLRRHHLVDLDDVIDQLATRLERSEELREIIGLATLVVDEFQDSTPAQLRLFRALLGPSLAGLTVVGDPNQAIYGWNGADPAVLDELRAVNLTTVVLTRNFRSRDVLVQHAIKVLEEPPAVVGVREGGDPPSARGYADADSEAVATARELRSLHARGVAWRSMAVLGRTHRALEPIAAALRAAAIPHLVVDRGGPIEVALGQLHSLRDPRTPIKRILDELWSQPEGDARVLSQLRRIAVEVARIEPDADAEAFREVAMARLATNLDAVTLTTFHRAKGLEWFHVHVVGVGEGAIPHPRARGTRARTEERRLLYVALSRATDSLSVSWHQRRPTSWLLPLLGHGATPVRPQASVAASSPDLARRRVLRERRALLARALGLKPELLLPDEVLEVLAHQRPADAEALQRLLGPALAARNPRAVDELWAACRAAYERSSSKSTTSGA